MMLTEEIDNCEHIFNIPVSQYLKDETFCNDERILALGLERCTEIYFNFIELCKIPPKTSTIRVNTIHPQKDDALKICENVINESNHGKHFRVEAHPILSDVLVIGNEGDKATTTNIILTVAKKCVVIDTKCGSAVARGAHIFVPGMLACSADLLADDNVSIFVDIPGKILKGTVLTPNDAMARKTKHIANGTNVFSRKELFNSKSAASGIAVRITERTVYLPSFESLPRDLLFAQQLPSIVVCHVLDPQRNDLVLDMCSSPGGKTTHCASMMDNTGLVIAIDRNQTKIDSVENLAATLGIRNIKCFVGDSTKITDNGSGCLPQAEPAERPNKHDILSELMQCSKPIFRPGTFDKIILDPPCSALGQRPQFINRYSLNQVKSPIILQKKLMTSAFGLVKPGGYIVYSTCTITLAENECLVRWALDNLSLQLVECCPILGCEGYAGAGLQQPELKLVQRFDFTEDHCDTIGFFLAKFLKIDIRKT